MATSTRNKRRSDPASNVWRYKAPPLKVGDELFRLYALPTHHGEHSLPIGDLTESIDWTDENSELTGNVSLTDPSGKLRLVQGQKIRCDWAASPGGRFSELWTMTIDAPVATEANQATQLSLTTGVAEANKGTMSFSFRKSRSHPHGWTCDQIAHYVCAHAHIPLGKLARGKHRITKLIQHHAKPLDVVVKAYRRERVATGRLFFLYWDGRLNIVPLTRSQQLLEFAGAIIDASYQVKLPSNFATALTVRATSKPGQRKDSKGKTQKVKRTQRKFYVKVSSPAAIRKFGYVHRSVTAPDAHTHAEARRYGINQLNKMIKPAKTLTVTVPIRPTIRRGEAFKVNWRAQGLTQVCFVAAAKHSVRAGQAVTEITAQFTDPFVDAHAEADAERRERAAKKRGGKSHDSHAAQGGQTTRSKRRGD